MATARRQRRPDPVHFVYEQEPLFAQAFHSPAGILCLHLSALRLLALRLLVFLASSNSDKNSDS
ncbi:MAG TPA: hypothetical protein DCY79_21145 [Planctomycetaceae bacterium]|nr:hypothetical protein [Planctomycetaceae bacterium]